MLFHLCFTYGIWGNSFAISWSPIQLTKPLYRMLRQLSRKGVSPKSTICHLEYCISLKYKSKFCMQVLNIHCGFRGRKYIKEANACAPGDVSLYWMYFTTSWNQMKYLTVHYKLLLNGEKLLEWSLKTQQEYKQNNCKKFRYSTCL